MSFLGAGIRTHDLLEHESPPITTKPGLICLFFPVHVDCLQSLSMSVYLYKCGLLYSLSKSVHLYTCGLLVVSLYVCAFVYRYSFVCISFYNFPDFFNFPGCLPFLIYSLSFLFLLTFTLSFFGPFSAFLMCSSASIFLLSSQFFRPVITSIFECLSVFLFFLCLRFHVFLSFSLFQIFIFTYLFLQAVSSHLHLPISIAAYRQCDQIWQFIGLWATF